MLSMELGVESERLNLIIPIKSRLTIVRGDSGVCKSYLEALLSGEDPTVRKIHSMRWDILQANNILQTAEDTKNVIFLVDDRIYDKSEGIADIAKAYSTYAVSNNQYYIVMDRGTTAFYTLSYDIHDILEVIEVDNNHYKTRQLYEYLDDTEFKSQRIVTEDAKSGYEFARNFFNTVQVESAKGKGNFNNGSVCLQNATAFLDTVAFGCHIDEFADLSKEDQRKLFYDVDSFEKLLCDLMSNKYDINTLQFESKESAYEQLMLNVPDTERLKTIHGGRLTLCLRTDCHICPLCLYGNCNAIYTDDYVEILLKKAGYNNLLEYHKGDYLQTLDYPSNYSMLYLLCVLCTRKGWYSLESFLTAKKEFSQLLNDRKVIFIEYNSIATFLLVNHPYAGLIIRLTRYMQEHYAVQGFDKKGIQTVSV